MITWWMKLGGNLTPGHDALLLSISGTGSFIYPVPQTRRGGGVKVFRRFEPTTCQATVDHANQQTKTTNCPFNLGLSPWFKIIVNNCKICSQPSMLAWSTLAMHAHWSTQILWNTWALYPKLFSFWSLQQSRTENIKWCQLHLFYTNWIQGYWIGIQTFGHKTFGHKTFGHKTFGHKVAGTTFGHSMKDRTCQLIQLQLPHRECSFFIAAVEQPGKTSITAPREWYICIATGLAMLFLSS